MAGTRDCKPLRGLGMIRDEVVERISRQRSLNMCTPFRRSGRKSQMEEVQDELFQRLTIGRSAAQRKFHVPRQNVPVINITYDSTPEEVKTWLQSKGFNPV